MDAHATRVQRLRAAGLLLCGVMIVHWLRYLVAFGSQAGTELDHQGHGYLADALPSLVALSIALIGSSVALRFRDLDAPRSFGSLSRGAIAYGLALFAICAGQEFAEGMLASGDRSGLDAVLADGGWIALPLALAGGTAIALVERALLRAEERIFDLLATRFGKPARERPLRQATPPAFIRPPDAAMGLAFGFARRPPPRLLSA